MGQRCICGTMVLHDKGSGVVTAVHSTSRKHIGYDILYLEDPGFSTRSSAPVQIWFDVTVIPWPALDIGDVELSVMYFIEQTATYPVQGTFRVTA